MPLPTPRTDEEQNDFIARCMRDPETQAITGDTDDQTRERRLAACFRQWRDKSAGAADHERKGIVAFEIKDADKGHIEAVFATFNVKDKDADWTLPGAFEEGADVLIGAYGHRTWFGEPPVGKGVIKASETDARLVGQFFLDTFEGREHFAVIKNLGAKQQWSYGYDVKETGELTDELEQKGVRRVLKKLFVHEISPVLVGAGIGTRTVAAKAAPRALPLAPDAAYSAAAWDGPAELAAMEPDQLRVSCLAFLGGDPEAKANYHLLYRDRAGNLNAHAIRALQRGLPKSDLPGVIRADVQHHVEQLLVRVEQHEQTQRELERALLTHRRTGAQFGP